MEYTGGNDLLERLVPEAEPDDQMEMEDSQSMGSQEQGWCKKHCGRCCVIS